MGLLTSRREGNPGLDITELAALAGNALVAAAMTDAWQAFRHRFASLLGRGDASQTQVIEQRLDQSRAELAAAAGVKLDQARAVQVTTWTADMAALLAEYPEVEADLRALVDEIQAVMVTGAVTASDHSVTAGRDLNITASTSGVAAGVIHGNVTPPGPTAPGRAVT